MKVLIACEFSGIVRDAFILRGHDAISCDLLPSERPGPHIQGDVIELLQALKIIQNHTVKNPCAKQTTVAVVIKEGNFWVGDNGCNNPQNTCPRSDYPTGHGYEMCHTICDQEHHAEINACLNARQNTEGANLYLAGHTYICDDCLEFMKFCGIQKSYIVPLGFDMMIAFPPCTHLAVSGARWFKAKQAEQAEALLFVRRLMDVNIERICIENPISIISSHIRKPDQIIQPWLFGHGETKATCLWLKNLPLVQPTNIVDGREHRIHKMPPSEYRSRERSRTYTGIAEAMAVQWGSL